MALNPAAFRTFADFTGENDELFRKVKSVPTAAGFSEVLVPGEPEMRARAKRLVDGIPVAEDTWARLQSTADELGAVMP
jgi:LDH2 family malate/lactate/ureidoglycolate dehydrogenase